MRAVLPETPSEDLKVGRKWFARPTTLADVARAQPADFAPVTMLSCTQSCCVFFRSSAVDSFLLADDADMINLDALKSSKPDKDRTIRNSAKLRNYGLRSMLSTAASPEHRTCLSPVTLKVGADLI